MADRSEKSGQPPPTKNKKTIVLPGNRRTIQFEPLFRPASSLLSSTNSNTTSTGKEPEVGDEGNLDQVFDQLTVLIDARVEREKQKLAKEAGLLDPEEPEESRQVETSTSNPVSKTVSKAKGFGEQVNPNPSASASQLRPSSSLQTQKKPVASGPVIFPPRVQPETSSSRAVVSKDESSDSEEEMEDTRYYVAMFAKPSNRKHKRMEDDGFLIVSGKSVTLKDSSGEVLESSQDFKLNNDMLTEQKIFTLGGKEVQIQEPLSKDPFGTSKSTSGSENAFKQQRNGLDSNKPVKRGSTLTSDFSFKRPQALQPTATNRLHENGSSDDEQAPDLESNSYYVAMFAKPSTRKRKVMEDDGFIIVSGKSVTLKDSNGDVIGSSHNLKLNEEILTEQKIFNLGGKEVQILERLSSNPFDTASQSKLMGSQKNIEPRNKRLREESNYATQSGSSRSSEVANTQNSHRQVKERNELPGYDFAPTLSTSMDPSLEPEEVNQESKCYSAMYAKPSTRKHKVMESDGFIIVSKKSVVLKNPDGNIIATASNFKLTEEMLTDGKFFKLGSKEVQIIESTDNPFGDESAYENSYNWNP